jgi:hypothetical protein
MMRLRAFTFGLLLILAGCTPYYSVYWGDWSEWDEWKPAGTSDQRPLTITSEPPGCHVFIDGRLQGSTPLELTISYPLLRSERKRQKYQYTESNWSFEWLILHRGDRPNSTKVIDSETEERAALESANHNLVLKKEGYRSASRSVSLDDSSAHFILKRKPCLSFNIRVEDKCQLSAAQKIYDTLFRKKYSKDIKPEELKTLFESEPLLGELFLLPVRKSAGCSILESELVIQNDQTKLNIFILDAEGRTAAKASSVFKTAVEREEFLKSLKDEIRSGVSTAYEALQK